jgi:hypothetical protein
MYSDAEINSTQKLSEMDIFILNDTLSGILWYEIRRVDGSSRIIRKVDKCSIE